MPDGRNGSPEILRANYEELCAMRRDSDAVLDGLWEMAASLLPEQIGAEDVLTLYRSLGGEDASHPDFAALCVAAGKGRTVRFPEPEPDDEPEPPPHVLSLGGDGAASAGAAFLADTHLTPLRAASAAELTETVADGGARYGILPLYSTADGVLMHFYRLVERAELKAVARCSVTGKDGTLVQYVLLQRRRLQLDGGKRYLEIVFSSAGAERLLHLPASLIRLGVSVCRTMLLPPLRDGAEPRYLLALDLSGASLPLVRLYLAGAFPEAEAVGYYDLLTTTV